MQTNRLFFALLAGLSLATVIGAGASLIFPSSAHWSQALVFEVLAAGVGCVALLLARRRIGLPAGVLHVIAMLLFATAVSHFLKSVLALVEHAAQGMREGLGTIVAVRILGSILLFVIFFWLATRNQSHDTGI